MAGGLIISANEKCLEGSAPLQTLQMDNRGTHGRRNHHRDINERVHHLCIAAAAQTGR